MYMGLEGHNQELRERLLQFLFFSLFDDNINVRRIIVKVGDYDNVHR
jgi:hypothetical protein